MPADIDHSDKLGPSDHLSAAVIPDDKTDPHLAMKAYPEPVWDMKRHLQPASCISEREGWKAESASVIVEDLSSTFIEANAHLLTLRASEFGLRYRSTSPRGATPPVKPPSLTPASSMVFVVSNSASLGFSGSGHSTPLACCSTSSSVQYCTASWVLTKRYSSPAPHNDDHIRSSRIMPPATVHPLRLSCILTCASVLWRALLRSSCVQVDVNLISVDIDVTFHIGMMKSDQKGGSEGCVDVLQRIVDIAPTA